MILNQSKIIEKKNNLKSLLDNVQKNLILKFITKKKAAAATSVFFLLI